MTNRDHKLLTDREIDRLCVTLWNLPFGFDRELFGKFLLVNRKAIENKLAARQAGEHLLLRRDGFESHRM